MTDHPAHERVLAARGVQDRVADTITRFAGSMTFAYLHMAWFGVWIVATVEKYPYGLLTMIVSLEAIFLATFVMISQNRQAALAAAKAAHDYQESEQLLQVIHGLTAEIHTATVHRESP